MRYYISLGLLTATTAVAQIAFPSSLFGLTFSPPCQQAIISTVTNGSFAQCFPAADLLPIISSNGSIIPVLDTFMSDLCYKAPCSNDTLNAAAATILAGCANDLKNESLPNATVTAAFGAYPLVREILCLKTSDPYTNQSYGGFLGNPPIPITPSTYNSTNGTFCVTSLFTQLSAYFGTNITLPYILGIVNGQNATALGLAQNISTTVLCNNCLFGAVDLLETAYPSLGQVQVGPGLAAIGKPVSGNVTLNALLNGTCAYQGLSVSMNGTLPANITVSIVNSTFPFPIKAGNMTM